LSFLYIQDKFFNGFCFSDLVACGHRMSENNQFYVFFEVSRTFLEKVRTFVNKFKETTK
jgi:hypothetical protein